MEWINCDDELPPCDGDYQICNNPYQLTNNTRTLNSYIIIGNAKYDGFGFNYLGCYRNPTHWRPYKTIEKKYGKLKKKEEDWGNPVAF